VSVRVWREKPREMREREKEDARGHRVDGGGSGDREERTSTRTMQGRKKKTNNKRTKQTSNKQKQHEKKKHQTRTYKNNTPKPTPPPKPPTPPPTPPPSRQPGTTNPLLMVMCPFGRHRSSQPAYRSPWDRALKFYLVFSDRPVTRFGCCPHRLRAADPIFHRRTCCSTLFGSVTRFNVGGGAPRGGAGSARMCIRRFTDGVPARQPLLCCIGGHHVGRPKRTRDGVRRPIRARSRE